ncbi:AraC family ligand binding domain-containing protein [Shewanella seohaensis]|nr:AraC family ligand binding domain-containing protein [Shewanella seohaensis]
MAFIQPEQQFNPDALDNLVIGIAAEIGEHDSGVHQHRKAQLLYSSAGCMRFTLADTQVVLPPTRAAWLPAGVVHQVTMRDVVAYRSLYFEPETVASLPDKVTIFHVNPLLKALIDTMSFWPWDKPRDSQHNAFALLIEELLHADAQNLSLPLPKDKRLQTWLKQLQQQQKNLPACRTWPLKSAPANAPSAVSLATKRAWLIRRGGSNGACSQLLSN